MTTTPHRPPSLRQLAAALRVNHSSLSAAIHCGRLTAGVTVTAGKVVITDADAAASQWHQIHLPRYVMPAMPATPATAQRRPNTDEVALWDAPMSCWATAGELIEERTALSTLVSALTADTLARDPDRAALRARIAALLPRVAFLHTPAVDITGLVACAEDELAGAIEMHDDDDDDDDDEPDEASP